MQGFVGNGGGELPAVGNVPRDGDGCTDGEVIIGTWWEVGTVGW